MAYYHYLGVRKARDRGKRSAEGEKRWQDNLEEMKSEEKEVGKKKSREEGSAGMPVYLGISCVKGGRGERRGGGGGRVEKEVESSTTLAGVTLEELEQTLLGKKQREGRRECQCQF